MTEKCPFCTIAPSCIIAANEHSLAVLDDFPVSPGRMKRLVPMPPVVVLKLPGFRR
jgi:diadenosine tetraphosphate (Ap4A) HIT family hydrolase